MKLFWTVANGIVIILTSFTLLWTVWIGYYLFQKLFWTDFVRVVYILTGSKFKFDSRHFESVTTAKYPCEFYIPDDELLLMQLICWCWFLHNFNVHTKAPSKLKRKANLRHGFWFIKLETHRSWNWYDVSSSWKHFRKWTHYNAVVFYAWQWQLINIIY